MILAVRDYALNGGVIPETLSLEFQCRRYNKLPVGNALWDNPDWLICKMAAFGNIYDAYRLYNQKPSSLSDSEWASRYPDHAKIVFDVDLRRKKHMRKKKCQTVN